MTPAQEPSEEAFPPPGKESWRDADQPGYAHGDAEADLTGLRTVLAAAARGDGKLEDVKDSIQGYLQTHGPELHAAAASLGDEVRRQTLSELYKWRDQLRAQPSARRQSVVRSASEDASVEYPQEQ